MEGKNGRTTENRRICWVITGAGHFLLESIQVLSSLHSVDVYLSRAASEVVARYSVLKDLKALAANPGKGEGRNGSIGLFFETDYSASPIVFFSSGRYRAFVIAPATANTVAKCALGIADSLASNCFAQANKSRRPIVILPTDTESHMLSHTPSGRTIDIYPRPIDLEYARRLKTFPSVSVLQSPDELSAAARSL